MIIQFVDRDYELDFLNKKFRSKEAEFVPIYGRRRVGKTELILEFIKDKPAVYFLSSLIEDKENLKKISELLGDFFNDTALKLNQFSDWGSVFLYLSEKAKTKRFIFVIDEFPYLARIKKGISSIFQAGWDQHMKSSNVFLILCGSSIGMMYKEVLAYKAPLYGRRTGQIELKSMLFKDAVEFFPNYSFEDKIRAYALLGGIPAYLKTFDSKISIDKNIENMLNKSHVLFNEPEILVKEELREPSKYMAILKAIAFGKTKVNEISNYTEIERTTLFKYLNVLEELGFIEKQLPVTEKNPHKSKKGLYFLKDEFFSFWFKFIFPFKSEIEIGEADKVIKKIGEGLNQHIGYGFENICRQIIWDLKPIGFTKSGRWWDKDKEIDIVCLEEQKKEALFIECKWSSLKEGDARKVLEGLKEKSKSVDWKRAKENFGLIGKKILGKENLKKDGFFVWDLEDLEKLLKKKF
ncbi:MAG TPA: ATP-binding protein [archaeon]|nr:ATP-binding protein [archaeon]